MPDIDDPEQELETKAPWDMTPKEREVLEKEIRREIAQLNRARLAFIIGGRVEPVTVGRHTFKDELACEGRLAELVSFLKELEGEDDA